MIISSSCCQLSNIRSRAIPEREASLKEKADAIAAVQARVEAEMTKQKHLEKELEHIRSLEPKVRMTTCRVPHVSLPRRAGVEGVPAEGPAEGTGREDQHRRG